MMANRFDGGALVIEDGTKRGKARLLSRPLRKSLCFL
jgi:hypothetical protein